MASFAEQLAVRKSSLRKAAATDVDIELRAEKFEGSACAWHACDESVDVGCASFPSELCILSFNLMKERDFLPERIEALLRIVRHYDPDFLCFQENTEHHDELLTGSTLIRENYFRSPFAGQGFGFKVSLYSKLPFSGGLKLTHLKGRPCITGRFQFQASPDVDRETFAVSSVHLTSGCNSGIRREQLESIYSHRATLSCDSSLVIGDFNADQPADDDKSVNRNGYEDVWPYLYPDQPGVTRREKRLDRAALRSKTWLPHTMHIVGQEPILVTEEGTRVTISDHHGIVVMIRSAALQPAADQAQEASVVAKADVVADQTEN